MAQITGVIKDKETGQVTLILDNGEEVVVEGDTAEKLNKGDEFDEDLMAGYTRAINFISYRPRSISEVRQNLERKSGLSSTQISRVIDRLVEKKWLDDVEFARWWVGARLAHRPRGKFVLEAELVQKGVDRKIAHEVLGELVTTESSREALEKLLDKKLRVWVGMDKKVLRTKLINFLMRKGFDYASVASLVDERVSDEVE